MLAVCKTYEQQIKWLRQRWWFGGEAVFNLEVRANGVHMVSALGEPNHVPWFVFLGFFLRIKGTRLARDERLVWSRSPTSQLSFLPLCLQTSDWVGFQGGCKILDGRHARLAAGQKPPVSSSLFLIRAVSFRLL